MDKHRRYNVNKTYTNFTKLIFTLRGGNEVTLKFPTEEVDAFLEILSETMKEDIGGSITIPEYNGVNPKNMLIRLSSIDVVQF